MKHRVEQVFSNWRIEQEVQSTNPEHDTKIYPLVEFGPANLNFERDILEKILASENDQDLDVRSLSIDLICRTFSKNKFKLNFIRLLLPLVISISRNLIKI